MENISLYTDGGCSGNPGPGGWAFVIVRPAARTDAGGGKALAAGSGRGGQAAAGEAVSSGSGGERVTTNNRMELTAVCRGLEALARIAGTGGGEGGAAAPSIGAIGVYTDSQYVQKGITQWIASWERNGWMTAGKEPVKNKDLWIELRKLSRSLPLAWYWVKGHAGNRWNEECDLMTQREIARFKS